MQGWGVGQIVAVDPEHITVYFETVGEKKLKVDLVNLRKVQGDEATSSVLDSKFKAKRISRRKRFDDPKYFNRGSTSRKQFIESMGATCSNWNWSWSFVNANQKKIIFGLWQDLIEGNRGLIFSEDWKIRNGKRRPSWPESRENLRLVEEEGYSLHVFTMINDPDAESEFEDGPRKIGAILNDVAQAQLVRKGGDWYALFASQS